MVTKRASIVNEDEYNKGITPGAQICFSLVAFGTLLIANGVMLGHSFVGGLGVALFWSGIIGFSFTSMGDRKTAERMKKERPNDEACPKCEEKGTIEVCKVKSSEYYSDFCNRRWVNGEQTIVNCMNVQCSYRCSLQLHEKEAQRRERTQKLGETDPESGLAIVDADAEEEDHRQELRKKRRCGGWSDHPENQRLKANFGSCPDCDQVRFVRWLRQTYNGMQVITLGSIQIAECESNCGYISKLFHHKKRMREPSQANGDQDEQCIQMQPLVPFT